MIDYSRKYALVTGGSSGMGLEYVKLLAGRGYNLIIVALFQEETDAAKALVERDYPHLDVLSIGIDLSEMEAPATLYETVKRSRPEAQVEVLINNAGLLHSMHFRNMTGAQISRIIMVHNHATAMICHYFLPQMLGARKGYILNVSSMAAWLEFPFLSTYASTKAFVKAFTRSLRTECKKSGVKVASVYFGAVDTPLIKLKPSLRTLARRIGVMIKPEKAASKALRMLFGGYTGWVPGFINKIAIFFSPLLRPCWIGPLERAVTRRWNLK